MSAGTDDDETPPEVPPTEAVEDVEGEPWDDEDLEDDDPDDLWLDEDADDEDADADADDGASAAGAASDDGALSSPVLRSCLLLAGIGVMITLTLGVLVAIVLVWRPFGADPGAVDQAELDRTNAALVAVLPDVEGLGPVTGRAGEPARHQDTCPDEDAADGVAGAEVASQPAITRSWPVQAGRAADVEDELSGALTAAGWERQEATTPGGGTTSLLDRNATTYRAEVDYHEPLDAPPTLDLLVTVVGAEPCGSD